METTQFKLDIYVRVVAQCVMKMTYRPSETIHGVSTTSDEAELATHLNKRNLIKSTAQDEETVSKESNNV